MLHITFFKYDCTIISSIGVLSLYIHCFKVITKAYNYMTSCIDVHKYISFVTYHIFKI